jgi:hypothetical protein
VKELLNVSNAGIEVPNEISDATSKVIQLLLHAIEAAFDRCESLT